MTRVTLKAPVPPPAEPTPDAAQRAALDRVADASGHVVVVGQAGSGKTTVAVAATAAEVRSGRSEPGRVLLLAPTRRAAATLRDRVTAAMAAPTGVPPVRTAASWAYSILRAAADTAGEPRPQLVSGAEQDVVLRELLEGHGKGRGADVSWDGIVPEEAVRLPGFRRELRDLLMRASEAGLGPEELAELGRRSGRPEWERAAIVFREYEQVMALRSLPADQGARYDPAEVVAAAADELRAWPESAVSPGPQWRLIVVDDAHDVTRATIGLLDVAASRGARIALIGNADESVQGYRGAVPSFLAQATDPRPTGWGAELVRLDDSHRQGAPLATVAASVAARVGTVGVGSARAAVDASGENPPVEVIRAPRRSAAVTATATRLRALRLAHGDDVPWSSMAVIARSSARLREARSALLAADIPCESLGDGVALHREPAVVPLLAIVRVALGESWTAESAVVVLTSRAVGLDAIGLRRLRRALVREERAAGGARAGSDLLVEALDEPARLATLGGREARRAALVATAVADARAAAATRKTATAVIWAVWSRLGVAEAWREGALAGSARDDADLDAVIALIRAAEQFSTRLPEAAPEAFLSYLEAQDFAADSLAPTGTSLDGVCFATPASAAGREWDVVVIDGLEEGLWPNLRLRDSVLGSQALAEVLAGRAEAIPVPDEGRAAAAAAARAAVLADETRALLVAVTRARRRVIVPVLDEATVDSDARPSRYVGWLLAAGTETRLASDVDGVSDLRDAVATLRREALRAGRGEVRGYAEMLARLALAGVPGADPREWRGADERSSDAPLWAADARVAVSPSKVESAETCPLRWALVFAGGDRESGTAQRVGSLVHEIAAAMPAATAEEYERALDERWGEIGTLETWAGRTERARASEMVRKLADYAASVVADEVRTEAPFRVEIGRAALGGQADRVHVNGGRASIADLKTGKTAATADEAASHAQLAMYQLAAARGAFPGIEGADGAELVYLGTDSVGVTTRSQGAIDVAEEEGRLADVVATMASASFEARTGPHCDRCPVRRSCPAQPEGTEVGR